MNAGSKARKHTLRRAPETLRFRRAKPRRHAATESLLRRRHHELGARAKAVGAEAGLEAGEGSPPGGIRFVSKVSRIVGASEYQVNVQPNDPIHKDTRTQGHKDTGDVQRWGCESRAKKVTESRPTR